MYNQYKELLDNETAIVYEEKNGRKKKVSFKMKNCIEIEKYVCEPLKLKLDELQKKLGVTDYTKAKRTIIRFSFLIQTTDNRPGIESDTTIVRTRWDKVLSEDSRFATFENCMDIFIKLCDELLSMSESQIELLFKFYKNSDNYLPIDYELTELASIHTVENVSMRKDDLFSKYVKAKEIIFNKDYNNNIKQFNDFLTKIKVKAYKTDRAKTGGYKTNRELRWETPILSPQFALFRNCVEIEYKLLLQICQFENIEEKLKKKLIEEELIEDVIYKCPITGQALDYEDLCSVASDSKVHGRSSFQVGHLQPLKNGGKHEVENIGWQTEDGNRIQGNLSLEEVDDLLRKIYILRPELIKSDL